MAFAHASFRRYVLSRRFLSGRCGKASWSFVVEALGDEEILASRSWTELRGQVDRSGHGPDILKGVSHVWRSYAASRRQARRTAGPAAAPTLHVAKRLPCS